MVAVTMFFSLLGWNHCNIIEYDGSSEIVAVTMFFSLLGWKKADMVAVTMFFSLLGWEKADMVAVTMFFSLLGEMESLAFFDVTAPSLRFGWETVQSCLF